MLPRFATVVFDCDSTLSALEGIDELAAGRPEVVELTHAAMRGEIPLEQVYGRRLEMVHPTRQRVEALGRQYIDATVPGARDVVQALRGGGVAVRVVSGGVRPAVLMLTRELGIDDADVAAVDIYFAGDGSYAGFDAASPLARSGGKAAVLRLWSKDMKRPVLMVGDGVTDLEARPPADAFAAYTGVAARPPVVAGADFVVEDMAALRRLVLGDG